MTNETLSHGLSSKFPPKGLIDKLLENFDANIQQHESIVAEAQMQAATQQEAWNGLPEQEFCDHFVAFTKRALTTPSRRKNREKQTLKNLLMVSLIWENGVTPSQTLQRKILTNLHPSQNTSKNAELTYQRFLQLTTHTYPKK